MYEIKSVGRAAAYGRRPFGGPFGRFPIWFAPVLAVLGLLALAAAGPYFPFLPLFFVFVFFVAPALGRVVLRGGVESGGASEVRSARNSQEKELLRALERHEEITAARVALESSLSVSEAEGMLAKLASGGHVEVRARDGILAYALQEIDRREIRSKGLVGPNELAGNPGG